MSRLVDFDLYLITDGWDAHTADKVEAALAALGARARRVGVQLRAKTLDGATLLAAARTLRRLTAAHGAALLVNDRVDVALAAEADGVHLPASGLPPRAARRVCGERLLVGASVHSGDEAGMAAAGGADLVCFGPVWETPSKARYGAPRGTAALAEVVRARGGLPVFALGGVDAARAAEARALGARVACIGAVLGAATPAAAASGARALA